MSETVRYGGLEFARRDIRWRPYHRIVPSRYPPVALFEDLGDPADWEAIAAIESLTNPRLSASIGVLDRVPVEHRVSGPGASYLMGPFVHASADRPGRFHDGEAGALYVAKTFMTALSEVAHHHARFLRATAEPAGWTGAFRCLEGRLRARLLDARAVPELQGEDWVPTQAIARLARAAGEAGVVYRSLRDPGGEAAALFRPNVADAPVQTDHLRHHWDGTQIDIVRRMPAPSDVASTARADVIDLRRR